MKFSYTRLKALVDGIPPKAKLAELLSRRTFEVESVEGDTLDLKLAANRYADAASHRGIAREIAAVSGAKLDLPAVRVPELPTDEGIIGVKVAAKGACSRYEARAFDVSGLIKKTPPRMLRVIEESGMQGISPIVDVLNFVMLDIGQPLHAFDLDRLAGSTLTVRFAKMGETIEGLDGIRYGLAPDILVIADRDKPQAIAGIKGGQDSGVTASTARIVVEAGTFDGPTVGAASRKLKLVTDGSVRFAHGLSPALVDEGLMRVTQLLMQLGAVPLDSAGWYPKPVSDLEIAFDLDAYESLIGVSVSLKDATATFKALGFGVAKGKTGRTLVVTVPATRTDVTTQEDLAEEVARVGSYDALPATPLPVFAVPAIDDASVLVRDRAIRLLVESGYDEVRTSTFLAPADWEALAPYEALVQGSLVRVANPISAERTHFRPSLLPLLLRAASDAVRRDGSARLAEVGAVAANSRGKADERQVLGIIAALPGDDGILEVKGIIEQLLSEYGIESAWRESGGVLSCVVGGRTVARATVPEMHRMLVGIGEIDLTACQGAAEKKFVEIPRFPSVTRDVAFIAPKATRIGAAIEAVEKMRLAELASVSLLDRYRSDDLPSGTQAFTLRFVFRSATATLTDVQVQALVDGIVARLSAAKLAEPR